jgi:hypothetical protein
MRADAMPQPRFVEINGRRHLWLDLVAMRHAQAAPKFEQPALFELREDHRPAGERNAAERYREPSLFAVLDSPGQV